MDNNLTKLKLEYNFLLIREKQAEEYFKKNKNVDEKKIKTYQKILDRLNELLPMIGHYTPKNILYGFQIMEKESQQQSLFDTSNCYEEEVFYFKEKKNGRNKNIKKKGGKNE